MAEGTTIYGADLLKIPESRWHNISIKYCRKCAIFVLVSLIIITSFLVLSTIDEIYDNNILTYKSSLKDVPVIVHVIFSCMMIALTIFIYIKSIKTLFTIKMAIYIENEKLFVFGVSEKLENLDFILERGGRFFLKNLDSLDLHEVAQDGSIGRVSNVFEDFGAIVARNQLR